MRPWVGSSPGSWGAIATPERGGACLASYSSCMIIWGPKWSATAEIPTGWVFVMLFLLSCFFSRPFFVFCGNRGRTSECRGRSVARLYLWCNSGIPLGCPSLRRQAFQEVGPCRLAFGQPRYLCGSAFAPVLCWLAIHLFQRGDTANVVDFPRNLRV